MVSHGQAWSHLVNFVNPLAGLLLTIWIMANQTKGNVLRLYLKDEDLAALKAIVDSVEIPQTEVMSRIMTAGIRACKEAGNRLPLPLKFSVMEEPVGDYRFREKSEITTHKTPHRK